MQRRGHPTSYLETVSHQLKHLQKYSDLSNPEKILDFIATKKSDAYKRLLARAYAYYANHYKIEFEIPKYHKDSKMPKLPTATQLEKLIAAAGKLLSLKLWISYKTGFRPCEVHALTVRDIDTEHNAITCPEVFKHGAARTIKVPESLIKAIQTHIIRNDLDINDKLFKSNARKYGNNFRVMRNRLAKRTHDPSLRTVRLYDFRHYYATMTYLNTRDVPITATDMGHKDINTTMKYIHLSRIIEAQEGTDRYITKVASNVEEARELIEAGFTKADEYEGKHIYRKHK